MSALFEESYTELLSALQLADALMGMLIGMTSAGGAQDSDQDGLSDNAEGLLGTDPHNSDTDAMISRGMPRRREESVAAF